MNQLGQKQQAALAALKEIQDGMVVGLGTGSTATLFIKALAETIHEKNWHITTVASSTKSADLARSLSIPVQNIDDVSQVDVTVDGADECDPLLNGIKGGGAALLYEKVLAVRSNRNIWMIDESKLSERLGTFPLPVEVIPFGAKQVFNRFNDMGLRPRFRMANRFDRLITDAGHYIIDIDIANVNNLNQFAKEIKGFTGVVEHGLFLNICDLAIVGTDPVRQILRQGELVGSSSH